MNELTAKFKISGKTLTVSLYGEIDHHSVKTVREEIDEKINEVGAKTVVLDLANVGFMDSSGLGLVLGRHAKLKDIGGVLKIVNPSDGVLRVLKLAGTERIISIEENKSEIGVKV